MATPIETGNIQYDEEGFLVDPNQWNRDVAQGLARRKGIDPLTEQHWRVIETLRDFYFENGAPPNVRYACDANEYDRHCMDTLFNHHPIEAWRIAGLPNPGEEAISYWS
jgi:TusE/DsrC/DsvC family sulfur relay protein